MNGLLRSSALLICIFLASCTDYKREVGWDELYIVSPSEVSISAQGGIFEIEICSGSPWDISIPEWITLKSIKETSTPYHWILSMICESNEEYSSRVGLVRFCAKDKTDFWQQAIITQDGLPVIDVTGITLSKESMTLVPGDSATLVAVVYPDEATDKTLTWLSSDESIAKVDENGRVTALAQGTSIISACANDGSRQKATCMVTVLMFPDAVDLGLSVKWASFNVGATRPEEYGHYFSWGETEPKSDYTLTAYKWYDHATYTYTKYITSIYHYDADNKRILEKEDDVAHVVFGGHWRMPDAAEWAELKDNCTCQMVERNGVIGFLVTSLKTGYTDMSIFFPAAGSRLDLGLYSTGEYGEYWSSSISMSIAGYAYSEGFDSEGIDEINSPRECGFTVRPVYD